MKQIFFLALCLLVFCAGLCAQSPDSVSVLNDSLPAQQVTDSADSIKPVINTIPPFVLKNRLLNSEAQPVSSAVQFRAARSKDGLFYLIAGMVLVLAFLRYFYNRYFTNLFRVFFNTSLRQGQLTDQLLQAKLPSLLFNIFFIISGGLFVYMLLGFFGLIPANLNWLLIAASVVLMGLIYLLKFATLKFTGWVTGLSQVTNTYIFVIFLINKIIGIFLVPFVIILSFSDSLIVKPAVMVALVSVALLLMLRFFRSYGLLQNQLKISRFHFFLYIVGIEFLPLLLIYKGLMVYFE